MKLGIAVLPLAAALTTLGCGPDYERIDFSSGGGSTPRLVMTGERAFTVRHGVAARVLPVVTLTSGAVDDDLEDRDLLLRSGDPSILRVERGADPLEYYFSAEAVGTTTVEVVYRGRRRGSVEARVAPAAAAMP